MTNGKKILIAVCGAAAAVYAAGAVYFGNHTFPNTTVDGREASLISAEQAAELVKEAAAEGDLTVKVRDTVYTIPRKEVLSVADDDAVKKVISGQNTALWPLELFGQHELLSGRSLVFEKDKAAALLDAQGLFAFRIEPQDAVLSDYDAETGYTVIPDLDGWSADRDQLVDAIGAEAVNDTREIDLTDAFSVKAAVTADDPELVKDCGELNALVHKKLTLSLGDAEQTLEGAVINRWRTDTADGTPGIRMAEVAAWTESLTGSFDAKLKELSGDGGYQYLIDTESLEKIITAKLGLVVPDPETEEETKAREEANKKLLDDAKAAAKKVKSQEEKDQILKDAEAQQKEAPEKIGVPADSEAGQAWIAAQKDKDGAASAADYNTVVMTDGLYIVNADEEAAKEAREALAKQEVGPATRSNALRKDDPEEETTPAPERMTETLTLADDEIRIPVIEADPRFQTGFGMDYVDVSIEDQYVIVFENAKAVMETSCVTGTPTKERSTHKGVFHINYKQRNRVLTGSQKLYSTFVNYWMPFDGGIGLHDAYWRGSFGGSIYKTNGSHGCVNLPLTFAGRLYKRIYVGETVYVH